MKTRVTAKAVSQLTVTHTPEALPLATSASTSAIRSHVIGRQPMA